MVESELLLFLVSVLPVIVIGIFIYNKDIQKEPLKLLLKLFLGGVGSCFLVLIVSVILGLIFPFLSTDPVGLDMISLIIRVFIGIALVEEFCKWIFVYKMSYNDVEFDELYDAILYSVFVALGFACFENLAYVSSSGIGTGILRSVLAVPGHVCNGVFMGYYLGVSKISALNNRDDLKYKNLILSILVPTIMHGIYDYCLFTKNGLFLILFLIFVVWMYVMSMKKIKKISSLNRKMKYKDNYCPYCGRPIDSNYCPMCGRKND